MPDLMRRTKLRASLSGPVALSDEHHDGDFDSGRHPSLDDWLRRRARVSEGLSARTYVVAVADESRRIAGFYALSATYLDLGAMPNAKLRRNMPAEVPAILVGRLAVDRAYQGVGLGGDLLQHAFLQTWRVARVVGVRALIASAIDDDAASFYRAHGFRESPLRERALVAPIEDVRSIAERVAKP